MIKFDLERALKGDKVVTRDGREVTQLVKFNGVDDSLECIYAFVDQSILSFYADGRYCCDSDDHNDDLLMAPKQLSGFINVYADGHVTKHSSDAFANKYCVNQLGLNRIACIDLSQFPEGHGL